MNTFKRAGLFVLGAMMCGAPVCADMIQIKGSDTTINLVQKLAEVYMQKNPGIKIAVTGGGSGTGIAAMINGQCDIANSSRPISTKELANASAAGKDPQLVVIAIDGLTVIVNPNNPVKKMTMDQIGGIYRGQIKNWSELGGADMPIALYGRQSNSGTFGFFREMVLKGEYSPSVNSMNGNSQIVEAVKADPSGIGYVGVGYVRNAGESVSVVHVASDANGVYASPLDTAAVDSGAYPIARPLYQYVNGQLTGAIKDLVSFEVSPAGQKIVEEEGFFMITPEFIKLNAKAGL